MIKANDHLSDDNPEKLGFLREWLMKRDVVFARTTPDQKLLIVEACQNLSHVVAVTGDGVNDSPAIKRSNIGIAMGIVGTDVAKDAADIILMDDNFASIIEGITQGRIIYDVLKKIIAYNLTSNMMEFIPVIAYFALGYPIPMTTFSIMLLDVCSNIYPNIAMAYEGGESNTMIEKPRNIKTDSICSVRLMGWSFAFLGVVHGAGGLLAYMVVMNDYGFKPAAILNISFQTFTIPLKTDIFNPYDNHRGNTNAFLLEYSDRLGIEGDPLTELNENLRSLNFVANNDQEIDMRIALQHWKLENFSTCQYDSLGYHKNSNTCYTLEAVRHAQTAFLCNTVLVQIISACTYRTIFQSLFTYPFYNMEATISYFVQIAFVCFFVYTPGVNYGLTLRPILIQHWCIGFGTFIVFFFYSELGKYLVRNVKNPDGSRGFFYNYFRY